MTDHDETLDETLDYVSRDYSDIVKKRAEAVLEPLRELDKQLEHELDEAMDADDRIGLLFLAHFYGQVSALTTQIEGYVIP